MREKIQMTTPLVEMNGDEMTRVLWPEVKETLIKPYMDLKTEYYDLGLQNRDHTDDQVTTDAANAIRKHGVGVKCATITPNEERVKEYGLKKQWKSPNGTIREVLGGTVFRKPILLQNVKPAVSTWIKPIIVGRHAYGDVYKNSEIRVPGAGKAEIVFTSPDGKEIRKTVKEFNGPGILQGIHNTDDSIENFARACFEYSLDQKVDCWFATKDTISKTYDQTFKNIFERIFTKEYKNRFSGLDIRFFYTLIDDAVARVMKTEGGFLWACKNYDGDVMSDMVASAFGSLAMMSSVLVSPDGFFEYEAAHGTVQRHYYKHRNGEKTSTNSVALIYAWSGALRKRGEIDGIYELIRFADTLESTVIETIEAGSMTGDLARMAETADSETLDSFEFIARIGQNFDANWSK